MSGPLAGLKVVELAGLGPTAFAAMMLADHGAEVIRVERPGTRPAERDPLLRSRKIVALDLKSGEGIEAVRALSRDAHGFIEGFRPGTTERLGIGPDDLLRDNPKLVYGRLTGWGQDGPNAQLAGHDINYIALTGALHAIGTAQTPVPPLALLGDFAGGSTMLAFGMVSAMLHAFRTGKGQVVDCAMMDGANVLMTIFHGLMAAGTWEDRREANIVDGGAHWYGVYETRDNRFVSIASMENQFYALLLERLGLSDDPEFARTEDWLAVRKDKAQWPKLRQRLAALFRTRT
ncbi:MAG: Carnitine dehydratase, partial [Alphaproteobacteria bacterium]|nr:Carnitine dehydratase [Alphaproteobacteria bacterium]